MIFDNRLRVFLFLNAMPGLGMFLLYLFAPENNAPFWVSFHSVVPKSGWEILFGVAFLLKCIGLINPTLAKVGIASGAGVWGAWTVLLAILIVVFRQSPWALFPLLYLTGVHIMLAGIPFYHRGTKGEIELWAWRRGVKVER
jgi:hypothetical protein